MSRAETLAGLTEAIAGHDQVTYEETPDGLRAKCNRCDERLEDGHAYVFDACRAHVAAVALAWLEGQMTEERTMRMEAFDTPYGRGSGSVWYARRVTAWAPVETGETP